MAEWDIDMLEEELNNIDIDMEQFGFLNEEIERNDLSDKINENYEIIIKCNNEQELEETYNKLQSEGYECSISTY